MKFIRILFTASALAAGWACPTARSAVLFTNLVNCDTINAGTPAALTKDADGNFYVSSYLDGVFRLTPNGVLTPLCSSLGTYSAVLHANNGYLYGSTYDGGTHGFGTLFRITTNGAYTRLLSFDGSNGGNPFGALIQGSDGNIYGTTAGGGSGFTGLDPYGSTASGNGTVFRLTTNDVFTSLFSFNFTNGARPFAGLLQGRDGFFYGVTRQGGTGDSTNGTVFRMSADGVLTTLFSFSGSNGVYPIGELLQMANGDLYGTTDLGGTNLSDYPPGHEHDFPFGYGTVFRLTPNGTFSTLHFFSGQLDGSEPSTGLIQAADGNFYGTTYAGGAYGKGVVYRITADGEFAVVYSLNGGSDGKVPFARLVIGNDGNFYGTAAYGGLNGWGTIFRLSAPLPAVFQAPTKTNNAFELTWSSVAGQTYQLQYNSDLSSTNWTNLGSPTVATNGTMTASDTIGSDTQRFYRAILLP